MPKKSKAADDDRRSVIVVGGGTAGLYCADALAETGAYDVTLLEVKDTFGGRIETLDLEGRQSASYLKRPIVKAECGPMRFELQSGARLASPPGR